MKPRYTPQQKINLAMSAMQGNPEAFRRLGVERKVGAVGELDAIIRDALDAMSPIERALDLDRTEGELESIAHRGGQA